MSDILKTLKKAFIPSDIFALLVILAGIFIAIFLSDLAFRLIGVSVAIIGSIALYLNISQRIADTVKERPGNKSQVPTPDYVMTIKKGFDATRKVIEDFNVKQDALTNSIINEEKEKASVPQKILKKEAAAEKEDEGFKIIKKEKNENAAKAQAEEKESAKDANGQTEIVSVGFLEKNKTEKVRDIAFDYDDGTSGVRVIIKPEIKSVSKDDAMTAKENQDSGKEFILQEEPGYSKENVNEKEETNKNRLSIPDLSMLTMHEEIPVFGEDAKKEFEFFLNRSLTIIKTVIPSQTVAFFLVNTEKQELILESVITDTPDIVTKQRKLPIKNDIVSQIVKNSKPEILTEINPAAELDLIPYYTKAGGVVSFIGIPVFYDKSVIGIICADTKEGDTYDAHSVNFFGQFTLLLASLVRSYTEKYDLLQESRTLKAINLLRSYSKNKDVKNEDIALAALSSMKELFEFNTAGFCSYDEEEGCWIITATASKESNLSEILSNATLDMNNTLIGTCIRKKRTLSIVPFTGKYMRYHEMETALMGGYFVCAPIINSEEAYGAIFMEGYNISNLTGFDIDVLERIASHCADSMERIHISNMLKESNLKDSASGILNKKAFTERLEEESAKSRDFNMPGELALFVIDRYAALDSEKYPGRLEMAYKHALNTIKNNLNAYDIIGKFDEEIFGVALINENPEKAKLRMEKIRNEVAIKSLESGGQKFNITISCGLTSLFSGTNAEHTKENAKKALEISRSKTNIVTSFD